MTGTWHAHELQRGGPLQLLLLQTPSDWLLLLLLLVSVSGCVVSLLLHAQHAHMQRFLLTILSLLPRETAAALVARQQQRREQQQQQPQDAKEEGEEQQHQEDKKKKEQEEQHQQKQQRVGELRSGQQEPASTTAEEEGEEEEEPAGAAAAAAGEAADVQSASSCCFSTEAAFSAAGRSDSASCRRRGAPGERTAEAPVYQQQQRTPQANEQQQQEARGEQQQRQHTTQPQQQQQEGTHAKEEDGRRAAAEGDGVRVCIITAHPDDETMFFAPTLKLLAARPMLFNPHILCLSNGDATGLGHRREGELLCAAADVFSVRRENVEITKAAELQDGMHPWAADAVAQQVEKFVRERRIQVIFTFDALGVSRHPNHVSVFEGVKLFLQRQLQKRKVVNSSTSRRSSSSQSNSRSRRNSNNISSGSSDKSESNKSSSSSSSGVRRRYGKDRRCSNSSGNGKAETDHVSSSSSAERRESCTLVARAAAEDRETDAGSPAPTIDEEVAVFVLQSHGLLRKYSGIFDILLSTVQCKGSSTRVVATRLTPSASFQGMLRHASQFVWFRYLFVLFSSYSYANYYDRLQLPRPSV